MYLCFVYIFEYYNLKDIGISLNDKYLFDYDKVKNILTISKNEEYADGFWPSNVQSLTAIVGNNGAGKTNFIRFILRAVVNGSGEHSPKGILVYSDNDGDMHYYSAENIEVRSLSGDVTVAKLSRPLGIECFYYGSNFNPLSSFSDILSVELSGMSNGCDGWLLLHDLQNYANLNSSGGIYSLRDYVNAYYSQNQLRMALFIKEFYGILNEEHIKIPRYIVLTPNLSGYRAFQLERREIYEKLPSNNMRKVGDIKKSRLLEIIYYSVINNIRDNRYGVDYGISILNGWISLVESQDTLFSVFDLFSMFVDNNVMYNNDPFLRELKRIIFCIDHFFSIEGEALNIYIDISEKEGAKRFDDFVSAAYDSRSFLTGRFFDLICAHDTWGSVSLSSGEQLILNLFSRLHYFQETLPNTIDNLHDPQLIILDEGENGLHPEWQRKYISILMDYIQKRGSKGKYQIILTSHSPIILSDIPKRCTNFLERDDNGITVNVKDEQEETFATNIFDLYRNSFFLKDGLMGKFAESKIRYILDCIEQKRAVVYPNLRKLIETVGDKHIQSFLITKLGEVDTNQTIELLQKQIDRLRKKKDNE